MEIWKTIDGYEDYQVSNLGNVKSLKWGKEKKLLFWDNGQGYLSVRLYAKNSSKCIKVHKLVAITFLNYKTNGTNGVVIDHINNIKSDNRVDNLQLITHRENTNKDRKPKTSKYIGVSWDKDRLKWMALIEFKNRNVFLGRFNTELEAMQKYKFALSELNSGKDLNLLYPKHIKSSKYKGVSFHKQTKKWVSKKSGKHIGLFCSELEAFEACLNYQI